MLLEVNPFVIDDTITLLVLFHRPPQQPYFMVKIFKTLLDKLRDIDKLQRKTHAWHKRLNQTTLLI